MITVLIIMALVMAFGIFIFFAGGSAEAATCYSFAACVGIIYLVVSAKKSQDLEEANHYMLKKLTGDDEKNKEISQESENGKGVETK